MKNKTNTHINWLDRPIAENLSLNWGLVALIIILLLAIFSRFYLLDARVMSHDETIHVYHNAWTLYRGMGYQHDPLSHGPLQTELVALAYFIFGDSDFSARIPAVLFSIATILFVWNYRRYMGRTGAIIGMVLMLISPYMLYYGRYVRNDVYAAFFGVVTIWAILRYLETGKDRYTYFLTAATVLHFAAKETSFIYTAQALVFLALYFIYRITRNHWPRQGQRNKFYIFLIISLILLAIAGGMLLIERNNAAANPIETAAPAVPGEETVQAASGGASEVVLILIVLSIIALIGAAYFLIRGYGWERVRQERSLGLLILLGTFTLPQLSAFPVNFMGWNIPTNAAQVQALNMTDIFHIAVFFVPLMLVSVAVGLLWNSTLWLKNAALFYGLYTILYTTIFTNGAGFFTGMIGSLGYWLEQQGVQRGSQPWYYYVAVQIPIYEYLPAIGSILALIFVSLGIRPIVRNNAINDEQEIENEKVDKLVREDHVADTVDIQTTAIVLLGFWAITSVIAYTVAGEKMPWLTVNITWSLILFASWAFGYLVDTTDWNVFKNRKGWLTISVILIFIFSFFLAVGSLVGTNPPFQGKDLASLQASSTFLVSFITAVVSGVGLYFLLHGWPLKTLFKVLAVFLFGILGILTARTAYQASYINYDNANELLVYAHSAGGVKEVMRQVEEISRRTTDGLAIPVAHDGEYPFWWYLRNYPNATYFGENPTRSLRENPIIIVGENNFGKIEHVVGQGYNEFDYIRLWWPNQDYYNLTWDRIINAIRDPQMRSALFQIWLNRDYTKYGEVTGKDMSLPNWQPSNKMRLYIRKDIVSDLWNYGVMPSTEEVQIDPYEGKQVVLNADTIIGSPGIDAGQFQRPRGIAVAEDGSIYIADTENSRIQHLSPEGDVLHTWGQFGDVTTGQALGGTFNQPWGIAVGPDGFVFVADTWNHRIEKFTPDGEFVRMWGYFGQAEAPEAFWGPRDVAVDSSGRVYVTDTGNKRIVVFDREGNYITQFGSVGLEPGQFDEPVGIAVDKNGLVYVADTWNQRIQVFEEQEDGSYIPVRSWDIVGWYGQSLDNKPYLSVADDGTVYATDPEGYRVLAFDENGDIAFYWGDFGVGTNQFGLTGAVGVDKEGNVWVTDTGNSRVMLFKISGSASPEEGSD
jgi:predicted membrane-bound mannosyltransferase/DNA-binding beta-propeller fold protein YncE